MNKILLSGGWGYQNIGDDAILIETLSFLSNNNTNDIKILSYDAEATNACLKSYNINHDIYQSLHKILYGNYFKEHYIDNPISFLSKIPLIKRKIHYLNNKKIAYRIQSDKFIKQLAQRSEIKAAYADRDTLILAGGGYLDFWIESLFAKYTEVRLAEYFGLKICIMGPTFGPFEQYFNSYKLAQYIVNKSSWISVRDHESADEIKKLGYTKEIFVTPDFALNNITEFTYNKNNQLIFIPFISIENKQEVIASTLSEIYHLFGTKISILLSQLWKEPLANALLIKKECLSQNCPCEIIIPKTLKEAQEVLAQSSICISQNLHGLILAYRAGTPIISLNDKRKFKAFMTQIKRLNLLESISNISKERLLSLIKKALKEKNDKSSNISLRQMIIKNNISIFDEV